MSPLLYGAPASEDRCQTQGWAHCMLQSKPHSCHPVGWMSTVLPLQERRLPTTLPCRPASSSQLFLFILRVIYSGSQRMAVEECCWPSMTAELEPRRASINCIRLIVPVEYLERRRRWHIKGERRRLPCAPLSRGVRTGLGKSAAVEDLVYRRATGFFLLGWTRARP